MEFDFTQKSRTLKKVVVGVGFKPVIKMLQENCLSKHNQQAMMINEAESDLLHPK